MTLSRWRLRCGFPSDMSTVESIYIYVSLLKELINTFVNYIFGLTGEMVTFEN